MADDHAASKSNLEQREDRNPPREKSDTGNERQSGRPPRAPVQVFFPVEPAVKNERPTTGGHSATSMSSTRNGSTIGTGASPDASSATIRLLILDSFADAELVISTLNGAGIDFIFRQVDTEAAFLRELRDFLPSLVIADMALPAYDARQALDYTGRTHPEIPVIVLGDRIGKEETVELLKAGARDCVAMDCLSRLGPVVLAAKHWEDGRRMRGQAEQAARLSEIRYRRLFESARDGILILDAGTGKILDVNPFMTTLLGYSREEYLGKSLWEIGPFGDAAASREAFARLQQVQYIRYDDLPLQTKDGRSADVEFVSNVYTEGDQRVIQCNIRDIKERKLMEKKLFQAQKLESLGTLTGGLAHDFNNILGVIVGNLDMARFLVKPQDDVDELIGEALAAAVSGAQLTRNLLAFACNQPLRPERIDVNGIVSEMAKLLRRTLGEDIEVVLRLDTGVWPVIADSAQLESSLTNLATNARDSMPVGGMLTIATRNCHLDADYASKHPDVSAGDYATIEVGDDGSGISPEILSRIFEPFYTTKGRANGTGLGLSMVFGFMKQSGGHVDVTSEVAAGTIFRLYLPRADADAPADTQSPASPPPLGGSETVLVVEDNAAMRRVVLRQLKDLGYRVFEAKNAAAALELFSTEKIDLLFTDVVMPGGMTGLELARTAIVQVPSLKVVMTSGFPESKLDGDGRAVGGMRLLSKPYRKDELARALREAFDA